VFVLVAEPQLTRLLLTVKRDKPHSTSKYARMLAGSSTVDSFFQTPEGLHDYAILVCHVHVY